jgi:hypothetical protein
VFLVNVDVYIILLNLKYRNIVLLTKCHDLKLTDFNIANIHSKHDPIEVLRLMNTKCTANDLGAVNNKY